MPLSVTQSFETGIGVYTASGPTVAQSSAAAFSGLFSCAITGNGTNTISFYNNHSAGWDGVVAAGQTLVGSYWVLAGSTTRSFVALFAWYTSSGVFVSTSANGAAQTDNASNWIQVIVSAIVPTTIGQVRFIANTAAVPANGEVHYVDYIQINAFPPPGGNPLVQGTYVRRGR